MNILILALASGLGAVHVAAPRVHFAGGGEVPGPSGSGYVHVGADSIFYEVAGRGPSVILIHDGLIDREVWDAQFRFFADRFRVVRYDRRGYGASASPSEAYSDLGDLESLCAHLDIEKTGLMGMSSGGRLAIDFTLAHPDRVTFMILAGAVVRGFPFTTHFYSRGGHLPGDLAQADVGRWYASEDPYEIYRGNQAATARAVELVAKAPPAGHGSLAGSVAPPPPALPRLGEVSAPTLILVGEFDIPDVHAHAGAINAGIPGSVREIIPHAGHLIPLEQPDLFNEAVVRFLDGGSGSGGA